MVFSRLFDKELFIELKNFLKASLQRFPSILGQKDVWSCSAIKNLDAMLYMLPTDAELIVPELLIFIASI